MNANKSISVSSLSTLLNCPRRYFYAHEMGWIPISEAEALTFGKAWHGLMEYYGKVGGDYREALANFLDSNEIALTSLNEDSFAMFLAMANEFEPFACNLQGITETETRFSFKLPTTRWRVNGIIDAVNADGCPIEYKTTSSDISQDAFYWLRLKSNLQVVTYAIVAESEVAKYIVARKPRLQRKQVPLLDEQGRKIVTDVETGRRAFNANGTPRQTSGNGFKMETRTETGDEFLERLREDMRNNVSFAVRYVRVSNEDKILALDSFVSAVRYINELRKQSSKASRPDAPYIRNCTEFNCKNCPYQGICLDVNVNPLDGCPSGFAVR
jgi:CRISPR/Cas system-associated exonuclease Cas4 (RecB family)